MWRMNPIPANQVLPSEISTREEGDTIHFSVKWVELSPMEHLEVFQIFSS